MAAHRYWRVNFPSDANGIVSLAEIQLRTAGGVNVTSGGTVTTSSDLSETSYPREATVDGNPSTFWAMVTFPGWWQYDFGAGNAFDISDVLLTIRNDGSGVSQCPGPISFSWSDDDATWTATSAVYASTTWTTAGQSNDYPVETAPAYVSGPARYWRVDLTANLAGTTPCIAELAMSTAAGGANLIGSGVITASSDQGGGYAPASMVDGNPATTWAASGALPQWVAYDFGAPVLVSEVRVTSYASLTAYAPTALILSASNDGLTWVEVGNSAVGAWTSGASTTQAFDVIVPEAGRFWRIMINSVSGNEFPTIAEVSLAATAGGPNLIGTGIAYASTVDAVGEEANKAVDGDPSTSWVGTAYSSAYFPQWWAYDFGAGHGTAIEEVKITASAVAGHGAFAPGDWDLQSSPDYGTWTTVKTFPAGAWTDGETRTFDVTPPVVGSASRATAVIMG